MNLTLLVREVSQIETSGKGCAGDARQKLKSTNQTSSQRGRLSSTSPKLSKKMIKVRMGKIGRESQMGA
jgi:hypothetical protein